MIKTRTYETYTTSSMGPFLHSSSYPHVNNAECFLRRYRVTIEPIEDTVAVLSQRLRRLWENPDHQNPSSRMAMRLAARELGITLDDKESNND